MHVAIHHHTRYQYDRPVLHSTHFLRLKPAAHSRTPIEAYSLTIKPEKYQIHWQQDPFGNFIARIDFEEFMQELSIDVDIVADISQINPFDFFLDDYAQYFPFDYEPQLKKDLAPYLEITEQSPALLQWLDAIDRSGRGIIDFLVMLNEKIFKDIRYTVRMEPGVQTSEETLQYAIGSCRDSAWLLVQVLRHLGLAARFVSGYLVQLASGSSSGSVSSSLSEDFTALHAWAEVYIPGAGWIGLDATSGLMAGEGHIPLACTPSPESAAPITGTAEKSETILTYRNTVERL
ncbi:transglutaminase family protein [Rhodocytophaga rosea]|nr:transglutaminase family protein [Rhodocytophaga rosea]